MYADTKVKCAYGGGPVAVTARLRRMGGRASPGYPGRSSAPHKCRSHLGFSLGSPGGLGSRSPGTCRRHGGCSARCPSSRTRLSVPGRRGIVRCAGRKACADYTPPSSWSLCRLGEMVIPAQDRAPPGPPNLADGFLFWASARPATVSGRPGAFRRRSRSGSGPVWLVRCSPGRGRVS